MWKHPDVAIIGGGILGVILARLVAELGLRIAVFRMMDAKRPRADTLRNQGVLQSGLRYVRGNKVTAERMWIYGRRLHEFVGLEPPEGRGVIQVGSDEQAAELYDDAAELGIRSAIQRIQPGQASSLLGPCIGSADTPSKLLRPRSN